MQLTRNAGLGCCTESHARALNRTSLSFRSGLRGIPFRAPMVFGMPTVRALVFLSDPARTPLSRADVLRVLCGLTPAEGRVADTLAQGLEIREAGDRLGITQETARLHVKRILAKTGVSRQAELVRLMLSLPGPTHI